MKKTFLSLAILVVMLSFTRETIADEVATVVNASQFDVQLYLKWSHVPNWSAQILLRRGQNIRQLGPDGAQLLVRFNARPIGPPREVSFRLITERTYPNRPGFVSYFRDTGRGEIELSSR